MKKTIITLMTLSMFVISCNQKTEIKEFIKYNLEIEADMPMIGGLGINIKKDTVMAYDNIDAFKKGLRKAIASHETSKRLYNGKVYSFTISDTLGVNIGKNLDILKVDSIISDFEELRPEIAKEVGSKFYYGVKSN